VVSAGATVDALPSHVREPALALLRTATLIEDNSVRSHATSLVNLQSGYQLAKNVKVALDVFNLFNVANSDIDYFYRSRLPGEPMEGVDDIHTTQRCRERLE